MAQAKWDYTDEKYDHQPKIDNNNKLKKLEPIILLTIVIVLTYISRDILISVLLKILEVW
jgi:hypothetical protein